MANYYNNDDEKKKKAKKAQGKLTKRRKDINAMYSTGPFFLNRIINGPIQVLTIQYIHPLLID